MAHEEHFSPPVPPANRPQAGPPDAAAEVSDEAPEGKSGPMQEQDDKRRIGDYEGAGEPPYRQPGGNHDADRGAG